MIRGNLLRWAILVAQRLNRGVVDWKKEWTASRKIWGTKAGRNYAIFNSCY